MVVLIRINYWSLLFLRLRFFRSQIFLPGLHCRVKRIFYLFYLRLVISFVYCSSYEFCYSLVTGGLRYTYNTYVYITIIIYEVLPGIMCGTPQTAHRNSETVNFSLFSSLSSSSKAKHQNSLLVILLLTV